MSSLFDSKIVLLLRMSRTLLFCIYCGMMLPCQFIYIYRSIYFSSPITVRGRDWRAFVCFPTAHALFARALCAVRDLSCDNAIPFFDSIFLLFFVISLLLTKGTP